MDRETAKVRARAMRRDPTPGEAWLWSRLRRSALGVPFRRQHAVGPFIADFLGEAGRLIVELDGDSQADREAYDAKRPAWLRAEGYMVLRFGTEILVSEGEAIVARIAHELRERGVAVPEPDPRDVRF